MSAIEFRKANGSELVDIINLLADDPLGHTRERMSGLPDDRYRSAFDAIEKDPNQLMAVAVDADRVVGCMQLTFLPGLSHTGMWRGQIESVRVSASYRDAGLGQRFFEWAFDRFKERGCSMVQLTSDKARPDAIRFYESLGFEPSHEGMKRFL